LIEHLSPTNSRVSYSSLHGVMGRISIAAAATTATAMRPTATATRTAAARSRRAPDGYVGFMVLHEITNLARAINRPARARVGHLVGRTF